MISITQQEKNSILFYQNAVGEIVLTEHEMHLKSFYSTENAYEGINTLLFPGIENETARVIHEKRRLPVALLDNINALLDVYCNLYSVMCKYTKANSHDVLYTYRVDRMNSLQFLEKGQTCSFLSTSRNSVYNEDFSKKDGTLLLEVEASASIEHIDVNAVLGEDSKYPNEQEILFAPFLYLRLEPMELTEGEQGLLDKNHEPPKKKAKITFLVSEAESVRNRGNVYEQEHFIRTKEAVLDQEAAANGKYVWRKLLHGEMPEEEAVSKYCEWKEQIHQYLIHCFADIKEQIYREEGSGGQQADEGRRTIFQNDLANMKKDANERRKAYEKQMSWFHTALSIFQPASFLAFALSFMECVETPMKAAGFLFATVCIILTNICKSRSLGGKYQQRTTTYLRLDELERRFLYETDRSEEKLNDYIEELLDIIKEDDLQCEKLAEAQVRELNTLYQKDFDN